MERMEEEIPESEYRAYQHFISNSKWCHEALIRDISVDTGTLLGQKKEGRPVYGLSDRRECQGRGSYNMVYYLQNNFSFYVFYNTIA